MTHLAVAFAAGRLCRRPRRGHVALRNTRTHAFSQVHQVPGPCRKGSRCAQRPGSGAPAVPSRATRFRALSDTLCSQGGQQGSSSLRMASCPRAIEERRDVSIRMSEERGGSGAVCAVGTALADTSPSPRLFAGRSSTPRPPASRTPRLPAEPRRHEARLSLSLFASRSHSGVFAQCGGRGHA